MKQLERMVSAYLDLAELQAIRHIPMTMSDWEIRLNRFLEMTDHAILQDAGKVTAELAKEFSESEFEKYRILQDALFQSDFDRFVAQASAIKENDSVLNKALPNDETDDENRMAGPRQSRANCKSD